MRGIVTSAIVLAWYAHADGEHVRAIDRVELDRDRIARLRLRQAYGRLIRRADDRGVFVILDRQLPSRLLSAFPAGVPVMRIPLADAVDVTQSFLSDCT